MSLGKRMFKGLVWTGVEHISEDIISFIIGIILARILTPEEYGIVGILVVFLSFFSVFIDSGFDDALVQKIDRNEDDKSTVFLFNIAIAIVSYTILFFVAPFIADFYEITELKELLRVLALILVINSFAAVHEVLLSIDLDFKTLSKINLTSRIIAGAIAIWMAYDGYGVWALAALQIVDAIIGTILTWIYSHWLPNLHFSIVSLRKMFKYGSNLLISELLDQLVHQVSTLFIAKYMSPKDLGHYSRGTQMASTASGSLGSMLGTVIFPGLVEVQENHDLLVKY
ncbi:MAG: lipopolysaccharide biosynthesis protein, partial [Bacteroidota bacterium]